MCVCVKRAAECHTNQYLHRLKLRMAGRSNYQGKYQRRNTRKFNDTNLKGRRINDDMNNTTHIIPRMGMLTGQGKVDC